MKTEKTQSMFLAHMRTALTQAMFLSTSGDGKHSGEVAKHVWGQQILRC